ncbi:conserved hypothetical protein [Trichinella spiralis]|uniref:hypothetical protein n=1 Tax=Trichinella spiralis TaxID=6334 RepID=UPI0001EFEF52|nr:conserved hypothetical protein [Trichinella spiralis]
MHNIQGNSTGDSGDKNNEKRRNCGSCFLVPDTPCIWCANRWKCSLFEHRKCIWCLLACSSTVSAMHCKEKQWECTKCESLSPKAVSKQDGIVEVPEETDFSGITSLNKTVPFKILCL